MNRFSIRVALSLAILAVAGVAPAQASFTDALLQTPDGQFQMSSAGPSAQSHTGAAYSTQAQTSYGVNKVFAQTTGPLSAQATSTWAVDFDLTGAPLGTPVNLHLVVAYDFIINAPNGAASWGFSLASYSTGNSTGFLEFGANAYTSNAPADDHAFDRPNARLSGEASGEHRGTLEFDLAYTVGPARALRMATSSGAAGTAAISDAFNTAQVTEIILPVGIDWTYSADVSGNPLNVHAVPEPGSLGVLSLGGIALMLRRRRNILAANA